MASDNAFVRFIHSHDWRISFGIVVTVLWIGVGGWYVLTIGRATPDDELTLGVIGNFLEGAFAPLAFLWLVIGYFLQKKELRQNTEAMKMQFVEIQKSAEQAVAQTEAIARSELHQRRESFLKIAELVRTQLGTVVGMLYLSSQMADGNEQEVPPERLAELWTTVGRDDPEVFAREMLRLMTISSEQYTYKLCFGTPIRTRHAEKFEWCFERLLRAARGCDEDGMIEDALMGGSQGSLYRRIQALRASIPSGFTLGVYDFDPDTREGERRSL